MARMRRSNDGVPVNGQYRVSVRGEMPDDAVEKISQSHARALLLTSDAGARQEFGTCEDGAEQVSETVEHEAAPAAADGKAGPVESQPGVSI